MQSSPGPQPQYERMTGTLEPNEIQGARPISRSGELGAVSSVCAVIPTKNRPEDLRICLQSLFLQTAPPQELIIVDQSSSDDSRVAVESELERCPASVRQAFGIRYVHDISIAGLTAARNKALELVTSDVVLFLDDDVKLEPEFLERLRHVYRFDPNITGVSGIVTNYQRPPVAFRLWSASFVLGPFHDDRQPVYWNAVHLKDTHPVQVSRLGGGLMSFRLATIRGFRFDERLRGVADGEDVDFCISLGPDAVLLIAPAARLEHRQSPVERLTDHWLRRGARATHFLYRKHWSKGIKNRFCFIWLNLGYAFVAMVASVRQLSLSPWRALITGVREG
jgi:GT2 family glycosyltransferase